MTVRAAACALLALCLAGVARGDAIWSALVLGTNEHPAKPAPAELESFAPGVRTIFGYNTLYLLNAKKRDIVKGGEQWIVPSKKVFLNVRCLDRGESSYRVQLDLYVRKQVVASSEVKLARGAPLYIRGPSWGKGRLVFILEVR